MEEGYIKFKAHWEISPALPFRFIKELNHWRDILYALHLIGADKDGVGFGNISQRFGRTNHFIISGSATGNLETLKPEHYSLVTDVDIDTNKLHCKGPVIASSESMSHGTLYRQSRDINGVIHVHNKPLWNKLLHEVPTTDKKAAYGTPEMAYEIIRLLSETNAVDKNIIIMEGHEEGIFTFGKNLDEAGNVLMDYYRKL
jgi:ribulose-5-phosphate 4-epimerase/fuculose-1-phosphate aldolase